MNLLLWLSSRISRLTQKTATPFSIPELEGFHWPPQRSLTGGCLSCSSFSPRRARAELCRYPHTLHCLYTQSKKPHIQASNHLFFLKVEVWFWASQVALVIKNPAASAGNMRLSFDPWKWQPSPVFLSGESYGERSLAGYRPWGHKGSDTTEVI